jgi:hypothetical protein
MLSLITLNNHLEEEPVIDYIDISYLTLLLEDFEYVRD